MESSDLLKKWFNEHGYKVEQMGFVHSFYRKDTHGQVVGVVHINGYFLALWTPAIDVLFKRRRSKDGPFSGNMSDPGFFPALKTWLNKIRKNHPKKIRRIRYA